MVTLIAGGGLMDLVMRTDTFCSVRTFLGAAVMGALAATAPYALGGVARPPRQCKRPRWLWRG